MMKKDQTMGFPPVSKKLLRVVVDQLSVDENIHVVGTDQVNLEKVFMKKVNLIFKKKA